MSVDQTGTQKTSNEIPLDSRQIHQTIIVQGTETKTNGLGVAGFALALMGLLVGWIPIWGWIIWFLGCLFSLIGIFYHPRKLAIAGLVISFIGLILLVLFLTPTTALGLA